MSNKIPSNLRGYSLRKSHRGGLRRLVIWIIVILIILWFVRKEIVLSLYDWVRNLVSGFL